MASSEDPYGTPEPSACFAQPRQRRSGQLCGGSRHGASTDAIRIDAVPPAAIAQMLQPQALALGGDLIAAAAFGHPCLWEKLLGDVICDLLANMRLPILKSH